MRGLRQVYNYGEEQNVSITELLRKPEVVNYLEKGRKLTYASQREKLRKLLNSFGDNLKQQVTEYNLENPAQQETQNKLYGAQSARSATTTTTISE